MYAFGAESVKCAACNFITVVGGSGGRIGRQMVVVENPDTVDENGKVVSNMAVGVAEDLK